MAETVLNGPGIESPEIQALLVQLQRTAPALIHVMQRLERLQATGALDHVLDLMEVVSALQSSLTDPMMASLGDKLRVAMELLDALMTSGVTDRLPALLDAAHAANVEAMADTSHVSPLTVLSAPREPELQFVMKFLLAFSRRLPPVMKG